MSENTTTQGFSILRLPREALFIILFIVCSASLFIDAKIPNRVADPAADMYRVLHELPKDKPVVIQSDWTNSTRGESRSQFQALVRILMRNRIKIALISVGDPQAPEVARKAIDDLNKELQADGYPAYKPWEDWVFAGFYPGAEATIQAFAKDLGGSFGAKRDTATDGTKRPIVESPVLTGIRKVGDLGAYIIVTGTKSSRIAIERLSGKVTMLAMVTGVMGPETFNYYNTRQLNGLSVGLKGAYDMESMMASGLNVAGADGKVVVPNTNVSDQVPPSKGKFNLANGQRYIVPLHFAIGLLILSIVLGNIDTIRERKRSRK